MTTLALAAFLLAGQNAEEELIRLLHDPVPAKREAAAVLVGHEGLHSAIPDLIDLLEDTEVAVRAASHDALRRITGQSFDLDPAAWRAWWGSEASARYHISPPDASLEQVRHEMDQMERDLNNRINQSSRYMSFTLFLSLALWVVFIIALLYFTGHLASKLKEWKEVMKQADQYLRASQEITARTDQVLDELDRKKTEIIEFFAKLKEENEGEMERFTDLLEQSTEHHIRLEVMTLRQKAEKEMEQTLGELKANLDHEIRRIAGEHRERMERDLRAAHERFQKNAESQTLLLEANFLAANGRSDEALKAYKRLVGLRPEHALGWTRMANVLRDIARFDEALDAYHQALACSPDDPEVHYHMAAAYAKMRRKDPMLASLAKAFQNGGEYKDEALNDAAFKPFWDDAEFKDLAEG